MLKNDSLLGKTKDAVLRQAMDRLWLFTTSKGLRDRMRAKEEPRPWLALK